MTELPRVSAHRMGEETYLQLDLDHYRHILTPKDARALAWEIQTAVPVEANLDPNLVMHQVTMVVTPINVGWFGLKAHIAMLLITLASLIMGCGVKFDDEEPGSGDGQAPPLPKPTPTYKG